MKRVRCPKCNTYITFDETRYQAGQTLVFQCTGCSKQFGIRLGSLFFLPVKGSEFLQEAVVVSLKDHYSLRCKIEYLVRKAVYQVSVVGYHK